ncbi:MAG: ferredoxin--NADP reductase [Acidimicrobiales bacterium]|nr:ferredoxin--NADP reductase [Acidimicrobiales bacterium]
MTDRSDVHEALRHHRIPVAEVVDETHDTKSFVLDIPDELAETFRYRAGQFCTFRAEVDGEQHHRCYSMSSSPERDEKLTVTVKRVPGGAVSNWMNDTITAGDHLEVQRPAGVFCLRDDSSRPVLGYCGGSGVTPVMSIAKTALEATDRPIRLLFANRDRDSIIFHDELRRLVDEHPDRFEVQYHLDDERGFLDDEQVRAFVGDDVDADHYLCGPGPFMDLVETTLLDAGVAPDDVLQERFDAPESAAPEMVADDDGADTPEELTIIFQGRHHKVGYTPGETVLQTARRGGLKPPFSCEAGDCATCMGVLHEGEVTMRVNNALDDDELEEGLILTCQSLPRGQKVTVEYESF